MADLNNLLGIMTLGDSKKYIDRLIDALKILAEERGIHDTEKIIQLPDMPDLIITPREAYYGTKKVVEFTEADGEISGELLMAYPPGIPIICPGERITKDVIEYVQVLKEQHAALQGTADPYANYISVLSFSS